MYLNHNSSLVPRLFGHDIFSTWPETMIFRVTPRTPEILGHHCYYHERVTSQVSLSGEMPYENVILTGAIPNESQLVLMCRAKCRSCSSAIPTPSLQHCGPTAFYLDPVLDSESDKPFKLNLRLKKSKGVLVADVTFRVRNLPRKPKPEDQEWRCRSESLV